MKVVNWLKFQGYAKRGPPWIKLHVGLIDKPEFLALPIEAKAVLPVLWITAARLGMDGILPDDLAMLAVLSHTPEDILRDALISLTQHGFIESDGVVAGPATELSQESREECRTRQRQRQRQRQSRDRAEQRQIPPPAATATEEPEPKPSWTRTACDDWIDRYGGTAPGGQIGMHLKPLVKKHGFPAVRQAWRAYLEEVDPQYASPARFATQYGKWAPSSSSPAESPLPPAEPLPPVDPEAADFFDAMKVRLSGVLPAESFSTWFRPVEGIAWQGDEALEERNVLTGAGWTLVLAVPSKQFADQMRFFADRLKSAAAELGRPGLKFKTVISREPPTLHDGSVR